ncbi:MAG TPA: bifunctional 2-polyprenyl-6-hydroxyphenol methylase/3-demethylubiquinol 3-O-methyltransferase UbiG [Patescibacteria group bacterium]|nr:bifunctional 2-polyprenyl-6-hydroxyphenol methylase/3-demethylubiquinol 3-O-methyltransferase UbiG [Patescibacteria group bacterium]
MKKTRKKPAARSTVDAAEIRQFDAIAATWWDESGPMKPLHQLNPVRLDYIRRMALAHFGLADRVKALQGLSVADIGCGGGLVAEPLYRMGASVTGVDAGAENIKAATAHAAAHGLDITYLATTGEALAAKGKKFDIVTALEIVEHVADVEEFMAGLAKLVKPGGLLVMSTLNRTAKSYALGIVAAEYILRWVPPGTHDWQKFLKPSELAKHVQAKGLEVTDIRGLVYNPFTRSFSMSAADLDVNYFLTAIK